MSNIRPVSDLRNNFAEISRQVHESDEPVILTKNGYGDMVVLSMESFEKLSFQCEIFGKLKEAEVQATRTQQRYSTKDVLKEIKAMF